MSESADGVRQETKLELRRRLLREVLADFEARSVGLGMADNLSRCRERTWTTAFALRQRLPRLRRSVGATLAPRCRGLENDRASD